MKELTIYLLIILITLLLAWSEAHQVQAKVNKVNSQSNAWEQANE